MQGWHKTFFWNSREPKITWIYGKREKILEPGGYKKKLYNSNDHKYSVYNQGN